MRILARLPFSDRPSTVEFQGIVVEVKPFQIILWVAVQSRNVASRPFPAFLDTGHNETFSISSQQLHDWANIDYPELPLLTGVRLGKYVLPRCEARIALYPNVPGERSISKRPSFLLRLRSGIIIQHPDVATRLPILGMRSLAENNLRLVVDGRRRHVSLRTGRFW